jgi:pimeloyl-ACP methyl ester carboxylesterase
MFGSRAKADPGRSEKPIKAPTLFIYGEHDFAILPETVRGIGRFIDAPFREVRFANSGHWVQEELPQQVNQSLLQFLTEEALPIR